MSVTVRSMRLADVEHVAALQSLAFPPPFDEDLLWKPEHLKRHLELFPQGQWVAEHESKLVGSCSNTLISEDRWRAHEPWSETVGGPHLQTFDEKGSTLYGLDITVHPDYRRLGVGRAFYARRFVLVEKQGLLRFGTACRMPDYLSHSQRLSPSEYALRVVQGALTDRTLTPLLRYGLTYLDVIKNYMEDEESGNAAALLEKLND